MSNGMNFGGLKVLMISSDRNIAEAGSAAAERMREYGALVEELHIVLMSDKSHGLKDVKLSKNVWVYPTNSFISFLRPISAARIGKKVVFERKFVRGNSVITADSFEGAWAGLKVKRRWRVPLEVQFHSNPFSPYFRGFQNTVRKAHLKKILNKADSVRVVSDELKSKITGMTKAPVYVLPVYIDRQRIEGAPVTFDLHARFGWRFIVLAVSRLSKEKNLPLVLEAMSKVCGRFPNTGLVIAGSGSEEGRLKARTKELGIEKNVVLKGWVEDLASYYKTSNAFIQASKFEGYGMALVEAGLSGLPVVTTPVGIAAELDPGKDAYICPQGDAECFANSIIDLIENNQKRENLRINMKRTLEQKLLSKDEYLDALRSNWEKTAKMI